jgi:hypothetical protein
MPKPANAAPKSPSWTSRPAVDEAQRDVEAAALTAGQGPARAVEEVAEVEVGGQRVGAGRGGGLVQAVQPGLGGQFLAHRHRRVDAAGLGHVADPAADAGRVADQVVPRHDGAARGGREQRGEHPQGGGLARAVGAEEAQDLARGHGQVDATHRFDGAALGLEGPGEPGGVDDRCHALSKTHVLKLCNDTKI